VQRRSRIAALPAAWAWQMAAVQTIPARSIRYIVPVVEGSGADLIGRTVPERWGKLLNHSFVADNIGGGGGAIACQVMAKAAPDGCALMQGQRRHARHQPGHARMLPYDAIKDFTPVAMIGGTPNGLMVNAAPPVQTVAQFVDYLRKNPARVSYGSAGQGPLTHLTMELFKQAADVFAVHIPWRGIAPAFTDLLGGQTQPMLPGLAAALPHIRSGRARPPAVTGAARHPLPKDVPTMVEGGFKGFDALQWDGAVGAAGLPAPAYVDPSAP
jgi:tripartite-type tricarboxylate transporter receptor subunit TctC